MSDNSLFKMALSSVLGKNATEEKVNVDHSAIEPESIKEDEIAVVPVVPEYRTVERGSGFQFKNPDGTWGPVVRPGQFADQKKQFSKPVLGVKDDGTLVSNSADILNFRGISVTSSNGQEVLLDVTALEYDNITSGLSATTVQAAIDEVAASITSMGNGDYQESVLAIANNTLAPPSENTGDRYLLDDTVGGVNAAWDGAAANDIVEFDGASWQKVTPSAGTKTYIEDVQRIYYFDGANWQVVSEFLRDASTTEKGIASFDAAQFSVTNGAVSILESNLSKQLADYVVGVDGDFATISAAIAQAVSDGVSNVNNKVIGVQSGFYTENVELPEGVHLFCQSEFAARIIGQVTFSGSGLRFLRNISVSNSTGHCISVTGTGALHVIWQNGNIDLTTGNFACLHSSNSNARFDATRLSFTNFDGSGKCIDITAGNTNLDNCFFLRPKNSIAATITAGVHSHSFMFVQGKYVLSGTARVNIGDSNIDNNLGNCIDTTSSNNLILSNSTLKKDAAAGFVVAGSGAFIPQIVSFTGSNTNFDPALNSGAGAYTNFLIPVDVARNAIYDNSSSSLSATNVQDAIDETVDLIPEDPKRAVDYFVGSDGDFTTISAAISQAVSDGVNSVNRKVIQVAAGQYNESFDVPAGVELVSAAPGNRNYAVKVVGKVTCSGAGDRSITSISIENSNDNCLEITGTETMNLRYTDADIDHESGTGVGLLLNNPNAKLISYQLNVNNPGQTSVSVQAGIASFNQSQFIGNIAYSGGRTVLSVVDMTGRLIGSSDGVLEASNSYIKSDSNPALTTNSIGVTFLTAVQIESTATDVVQGAGVFSYGILGYTSSGKNLAATLNGGLGGHIASVPVDIRGLSYNNSVSGLSAVSVQAAIDELASSPASAAKYVIEDTDKDTAWGTPSGGFYSRTILASAHNKGTDPVVYAYDFTGGSVVRSLLFDRIEINGSGDVTIYAPESPDGRVQAKIVIL